MNVEDHKFPKTTFITRCTYVYESKLIYDAHRYNLNNQSTKIFLNQSGTCILVFLEWYFWIMVFRYHHYCKFIHKSGGSQEKFPGGGDRFIHNVSHQGLLIFRFQGQVSPFGPLWASLLILAFFPPNKITKYKSCYCEQHFSLEEKLQWLSPCR